MPRAANLSPQREVNHQSLDLFREMYYFYTTEFYFFQTNSLSVPKSQETDSPYTCFFLSGNYYIVNTSIAILEMSK